MSSTTLVTLSPRATASQRRRASVGTIANPRRNVLPTVLTAVIVAYSLLPLAWLVINASTTQGELFSRFDLRFSGAFAAFDNIALARHYDDGGVRRRSG